MSALDGTDTPVDFHGGDPYKGKRAVRLKPCSREIKMLRPICKPCEDAVGGAVYLAAGWQENCDHDPYVSVVERKVSRPVYEDILDAEGNPTGQKRITGTETISTFEAAPNWVSVTHAGGMNKGRGVDRALRRGYIYPQQLRSPAFPNGIKMRCMFRECFNDNLKQYRNGWFCREIEAKLVKVSDSEETWEVGQFSARSDKIQQQILDRQQVGV